MFTINLCITKYISHILNSKISARVPTTQNMKTKVSKTRTALQQPRFVLPPTECFYFNNHHHNHHVTVDTTRRKKQDRRAYTYIYYSVWFYLPNKNSTEYKPYIYYEFLDNHGAVPIIQDLSLSLVRFFINLDLSILFFLLYNYCSVLHYIYIILFLNCTGVCNTPTSGF